MVMDVPAVAVAYDDVVSFHPDKVSVEWAKTLGQKLERASWAGFGALHSVLPADTAAQLLDAACSLLKQEPSLVDVDPPEEDLDVIVVGDTHGQLHDVLLMLETVGYPSSKHHYIFNGDFVDRGAWGVETLVLFAALKVALPSRVTLLRGNHESSTCTRLYGFKTELFRKYDEEGHKLYKLCKQLFAALPLAALVGGASLVLHGGLFRRGLSRAAAKGHQHLPRKRKRINPTRLGSGPPRLGTLEDLRAASKGSIDPNGTGASIVATDVLWSDPVTEPGIRTNDARGVGLIFGPDITEEFLAANGLRLILRSHEGPDARFGREDLPGMGQGFSIDHITPCGRLITVFSAPDYPQFQTDGEERYHNLGAVAVLRGPTWDEPGFVQYGAVLPRPEVQATYEYNFVPGSDEEMELGVAGSDASMASSLGSGFASGIDEEEDAVEVSSLNIGLDAAVTAGEIASVDEASARATQQAMQATAEAVAKLQLQSRAAATKPAANSGIVDAHVLQQQSGATGNGVAPDLATTPAMPNQPLLPSLQPADSGYLADTEGQPMRGPGITSDAPMKQANGVRHRPATRKLNQASS